MAPEDLDAIVRLAHSTGIYVLLDECYVYLTFYRRDGQRRRRAQSARST